MPESRWRIALIDSGLSADGRIQAVDACRFIDADGRIESVAAIPDRLGHGSRMAAIIASCGVSIDWLDAQVFGDSARTTAAAVAAAIDWSVSRAAQLIHLSLGLRDPRDVLAGSVERAASGGCIIVASTPARGDMTYPARYPRVLRATGDARCTADQISWLQSAQAEFGACPTWDGAGGASVGAAHLTRFIARHCRAGLDQAELHSSLRRLATFVGPERRI